MRLTLNSHSRHAALKVTINLINENLVSITVNGGGGRSLIEIGEGGGSQSGRVVFLNQNTVSNVVN